MLATFANSSSLFDWNMIFSLSSSLSCVDRIWWSCGDFVLMFEKLLRPPFEKSCRICPFLGFRKHITTFRFLLTLLIKSLIIKNLSSEFNVIFLSSVKSVCDELNNNFFSANASILRKLLKEAQWHCDMSVNRGGDWLIEVTPIRFTNIKQE